MHGFDIQEYCVQFEDCNAALHANALFYRLERECDLKEHVGLLGLRLGSLADVHGFVAYDGNSGTDTNFSWVIDVYFDPKHAVFMI